MDPRQREQTLNEYAYLQNNERLARLYGWRIQVIDSETRIDLYVNMGCRTTEERFLLRVRSSEYPDRPPSCQFVDQNGQEAEGGVYWPHDSRNVFRRGDTPPTICLPGNLEYHDQSRFPGHVVWNPSLYPIRKMVQDIQVALNRFGVPKA